MGQFRCGVLKSIGAGYGKRIYDGQESWQPAASLRAIVEPHLASKGSGTKPAAAGWGLARRSPSYDTKNNVLSLPLSARKK